MDRVLGLLLEALLHAPQGQDDEHHEVAPRAARTNVLEQFYLLISFIAASVARQW